MVGFCLFDASVKPLRSTTRGQPRLLANVVNLETPSGILMGTHYYSPMRRVLLLLSFFSAFRSCSLPPMTMILIRLYRRLCLLHLFGWPRALLESCVRCWTALQPCNGLSREDGTWTSLALWIAIGEERIYCTFRGRIVGFSCLLARRFVALC